MRILETIEEFIAKTCQQMRVPASDVEIMYKYGKMTVKIPKNKWKDKELKELVNKKIIEITINKQVKENFGTWDEFNRKVNKSHRTKLSIINNLYKMKCILNEMNLDFEIVKTEPEKIVNKS